MEDHLLRMFVHITPHIMHVMRVGPLFKMSGVREGGKQAPVPLSSAPTLRMPLASISKVTSICGTPLGAGGMPVKSNWPSLWLSFVMARSPSYTCVQSYMVSVCCVSPSDHCAKVLSSRSCPSVQQLIAHLASQPPTLSCNTIHAKLAAHAGCNVSAVIALSTSIQLGCDDLASAVDRARPGHIYASKTLLASPEAFGVK